MPMAAPDIRRIGKFAFMAARDGFFFNISASARRNSAPIMPLDEAIKPLPKSINLTNMPMVPKIAIEDISFRNDNRFICFLFPRFPDGIIVYMYLDGKNLCFVIVFVAF